MNKIKTFFSVLKKTFTSPAYYADILKAPLSFSFKFFYFYFFLYALIGMIIFTVVFSLTVAPQIKPFLSNLPEQVKRIYPTELTINIKNGIVSTNTQEPYFISMEKIEKIFFNNPNYKVGTDPIVNLLVIDTNGSIDNFNEYKTVALLTKQSLTFVNSNKLETYSLTEVKDLTINQQLVAKLTNDMIMMISPYVQYITLFLAFLMFLMFFFVSSGLLLYLLFMALIIKLIAKTLSYPLAYKKCYQIGLHLVVITTTIFGILQLLSIHLFIPFLRTIILSALTIIIIKAIKARDQISPVVPQTLKPSTTTSV